MTAGNTAFGESSPAIPVLHLPDPLSMTTAGLDMMMFGYGDGKGWDGMWWSVDGG